MIGKEMGQLPVALLSAPLPPRTSPMRPRSCGWRSVIDLADGDPAKGNLLIGSPLAIALAHRGAARMCLGIPGWRDDFDQSIAMARAFDPATRALVIMYKCVLGLMHGTLLPDQAALTDTLYVHEAAFSYTAAFRDADSVASLDALRRGLVIAQDSGNRFVESRLTIVLSRLDVGSNGAMLSGTSSDQSMAVTVVLFTQGKALVNLEFDSAPNDPIDPGVATDIGRKQDAAIKNGLPQ